MTALAHTENSARTTVRKSRLVARTLLSAAVLVALGTAAPAVAGPYEQAARMHARLAGVPPSASVLAEMANDIQGGNPTAAAYLAMENPNFYSVVLKNFAMPWTNRDQTVFVPLNDYAATVIGMVRDNVPFNTAAVGRHPLRRRTRAWACRRIRTRQQQPLRRPRTTGVDLNPAVLVQTTQSAVTGFRRRRPPA